MQKNKKPILADGYYWAKITSHTIGAVHKKDSIVGRYSLIKISTNNNTVAKSKWVTLYETEYKSRNYTLKYFEKNTVCEDILPIPNPN